MNRRDFLHHTVAASALLGVSAPSALASPTLSPASAPSRTFKLKYAPHFGTFKNSAGDDPIDQLHFMADNGFTAIEDNSLMKRPVELQQKIGDTLAKLKMTMGVFVIDGGDNWKAVSYTHLTLPTNREV